MDGCLIYRDLENNRKKKRERERFMWLVEWKQNKQTNKKRLRETDFKMWKFKLVLVWIILFGHPYIVMKRGYFETSGHRSHEVDPIVSFILLSLLSKVVKWYF